MSWTRVQYQEVSAAQMKVQLVLLQLRLVAG